MIAGVLIIALPIAVAAFGVLFRNALEARREGDYRGMWGTLFWSVLPYAVVAIIWASNTDASAMVRNSALGFVGAILGATGLIWLGYVFQGTSKAVALQEKNSTSQTNQNVTSHGQSGGITAHTVNK